MTNRATYYQYTYKRREPPPVSGKPTCEIRQWCITLGAVLVGLLALFILLAAGGVFGLIGPWAIFAGALVLTRRSEELRKASL
jgi:hypothetical protein